MKKILITFALLVSLANIGVVYAADVPLNYNGLVQCDGVVDSKNPNETQRNKECNFAALVSMINHTIQWVFGLTIPIFIFILCYAGFLYMGPPSSGKRAQAKKMLWAALTGFVIMLSAYFIVVTLLGWLVAPDFKGADSLIEIKK